MAISAQPGCAELTERPGNEPVVSIALPVCNVERYLPNAIESILGQSFESFELIIADFGSTDNTFAIAGHYAARDSRIRTFRAENCSLPEARNRASFFGHGKYIAVADADDLYLPDRLRCGVEFMEQHPEIGALGTAVEWISAEGKPLQVVRHPLANSEIQSTLLKYCALWHPTALVRREAFLKAGGYRAVFSVAHDYDLWLRIAEHYQIANLDQATVKYRIHPHQVSVRCLRQQTLYGLAAQASARARRMGRPDPILSTTQITPEFLKALGVSELEQKREVIGCYHQWISHMYLAEEYTAALGKGIEVLQGDLGNIESRRIADLYLTVASLWWRQRRPLKGFLAACRAFITWPAISRRALGAALRRLGLTWRPSAT